MRDTIDMARESGLLPILNEDAFQKWEWEKTKKVLKRFEALVRADERNRTWTQENWTEYERSIAAQEREACLNCYSPDDTATDWADKIRARSKDGK
jgi:uncharacterized protein YifE (UPF0438 family)